MDKFESQFTDLDVQTSYMESAMSDTTAVATPQDQVDNLINQVADEAGLEREHALQLPPTAAPAMAAPAAVEKDKVGEEDGRLADRLRALRVRLVIPLTIVQVCCATNFKLGGISPAGPRYSGLGIRVSYGHGCG
jgi:hypothetical protein